MLPLPCRNAAEAFSAAETPFTVGERHRAAVFPPLRCRGPPVSARRFQLARRVPYATVMVVLDVRVARRWLRHTSSRARALTSSEVLSPRT
jgi:hypothetical protein